MKPVTPSSITSGTDPRGHAMTGVPHAIASIITRPNGYRDAQLPLPSPPMQAKTVAFVPMPASMPSSAH
jgi:hypothetical protein